MKQRNPYTLFTTARVHVVVLHTSCETRRCCEWLHDKFHCVQNASSQQGGEGNSQHPRGDDFPHHGPVDTIHSGGLHADCNDCSHLSVSVVVMMIVMRMVVMIMNNMERDTDRDKE